MRIYNITCCLLAALLLAVLCGCSAPQFDIAQEIGVIAREEGSGTRAAFAAAFGGLPPEESGGVDPTTPRAVVTGSSAVMLAAVAADRHAIGYASLAALGEEVRSVAIDSVMPTAENVRNGSYPAVRRLGLVTAPGLSPAAQGFVEFILSAQGQQIIGGLGFVSSCTAPPFDSSRAVPGKVTASGSSALAPAVERLAEAYLALVPSAHIEVQQTDSSTGIAAAAAGLCDIGLASRELTASEAADGLWQTTAALDGIAVIIHPENPIRSLSVEQVRAIFSGEVTRWEDIIAAD